MWAFLCSALVFENKQLRIHGGVLVFLLFCALRADGYTASAAYLQVRIFVLCLTLQKQTTSNTGRRARIFFILCFAGLRSLQQFSKTNHFEYWAERSYFFILCFAGLWVLCLSCVSACAFFVLCLSLKNKSPQIQGGALVLFFILCFAGLRGLRLSCVPAGAHLCALP